MIGISVDTKVKAELEAMAAKVPAAEKAGLKAAAQVLKDAEAQNIQEIEDAPIPTSPTGRELWEHTGQLPKGLKVSYPSPHSAAIDIKGPAAAYAQRREGLGVDWTPKDPAGGVVRQNQFAHDADEEARNEAQDAFTENFGKGLGL